MIPRVSVIIPVYNSEKYLRQCLDSILGQTLHFFELILVDDGSTDKSLDICVAYAQKDSRVQIYRQRHKGPGPARNLGLKLAQGKYLSFLDSDDFFEPDMLEKLYQNAERTKSDIVFCNCSKFDDLAQKEIIMNPNPYRERIPKKHPINPLDYSDILFLLSSSEAWRYLFNTGFIKKYDLKFGQTTCGEDMVFTMPARALAKRILFLDKVLLHYRICTKTQLSQRSNIAIQLKKSYRQTEKILRKYGLYKILEKTFKMRKEYARIWLKNQRVLGKKLPP